MNLEYIIEGEKTHSFFKGIFQKAKNISRCVRESFRQNLLVSEKLHFINRKSERRLVFCS